MTGTRVSLVDATVDATVKPRIEKYVASNGTTLGMRFFQASLFLIVIVLFCRYDGKQNENKK